MEPLTSMGRIENGECYLRAGFQSQTINQQAFVEILGDAFEQADFPAGRLDWWRADLDIPVETYRGIANNHTVPAKEIFVDGLARAEGRSGCLSP